MPSITLAWYLLLGAFLLSLVAVVHLRRRLATCHAEQEKFIRALSDAFIVLDNQSRFVLISDRAKEAFRRTGKDPRSLFGRTYWQTFPEAVGSRLEQEFKRVLAERTTAEFEAFFPTQKRWFEITAFPSEHDRISIFFRDITDRRNAIEETQKALGELNDVKAALDEHAIVAITDPRGRITYVNEKFCAISRYTRQELLGQDHRIINSGHHSKRFIRELWETIGGGHVWKGEIKNKAKDGSFYWVDTTIVPYLGKDGQPVQYIAIRADITERKRAEEALHKAQQKLRTHADTLEQTVERRTHELREKIGELEAFSYSVSHDMRQPLRSMQGYAKILLDDYGPLLGHEPRRYLERIRASANRLDRLIQDVLTYSRATRAEGSLTALDLDQTVRDIIESYPMLREAPIEVQIPELKVLAYEVALTQCLSNLLANAVKFMPPGREPKIRVWTETDERVARLFVRDNGIGIAPENQARIFEIFARVNSNEVYDGTGIGLSIVKKAIEKMGGRIGVESELGQGSTFWIELQLAEVSSPFASVDAPRGLHSSLESEPL